MNFLTWFAIIIFFTAFISLFNERFLRIPNDIALLLGSFLLCVSLKTAGNLLSLDWLNGALSRLGEFGFESYLLDGVLCFMLFAGAGEVHFNKFKSNLKNITLLSFLTTAISAVLFGLLFFAASRTFGWELDIWVCVLLGCIVSPTDPIAATGIMNKLGLSKNVTTVIESESLFNDGMGVALFAFVKSIVTNIGRENFVLLMLREVLGAAAVALAVSALLLFFVGKSKKPQNHILLSILAVSSVYVICERCGFSGVIASVVCGMTFSYGMDKMARYRMIVDRENLYERFWEIIDSILNSVLFVMIGFSVVRLNPSNELFAVGATAVIAVLISRAVGVALPTAFNRKNNIPGGYDLIEYTALMTWSALKGGLTLALVLSSGEILPSATYELLLGAAYVIIIFTVIVQGLTTKKIYRMIERSKSKRIRKESCRNCGS